MAESVIATASSSSVAADATPVPALTSAQDRQRGQSGGFSFGDLFRTHPTLERRLAQLDQLEQQLGQAH